MTQYEIMQKRKSVRNYQPGGLEGQALKSLSTYVGADWKGPFGTRPYFKIISLEGEQEAAKGTLGTYGLIRGAKVYIAGAAENTDQGMIDFGYCMEKIILEATRLGLGTCWLGGSFKKTVINEIFKEQHKMKSKEIVPAITPIGFEVSKVALLDRVLKGVMKTDQRKPWSALFLDLKTQMPFEEKGAGTYRDALEAVRIAPSARNGQPWRILRDAEKSAYHFMTTGDVLMDMGLAMAHFELVAKEQGLKGTWIQRQMTELPASMKYITTWQAEN